MNIGITSDHKDNVHNLLYLYFITLCNLSYLHKDEDLFSKEVRREKKRRKHVEKC